MSNVLQSRLTLHLYGGLNDEGKEIVKMKTFSNVDNNASNENLKTAAASLASLQQLALQTVTRSNQYDIFY